MMSKAGGKFETDLKESLVFNKHKSVKVHWDVINAPDRIVGRETEISKVKEVGEDGYEEQEAHSPTKDHKSSLTLFQTSLAEVYGLVRGFR